MKDQFAVFVPVHQRPIAVAAADAALHEPLPWTAELTGAVSPGQALTAEQLRDDEVQILKIAAPLGRAVTASEIIGRLTKAVSRRAVVRPGERGAAGTDVAPVQRGSGVFARIVSLLHLPPQLLHLGLHLGVEVGPAVERPRLEPLPPDRHVLMEHRAVLTVRTRLFGEWKSRGSGSQRAQSGYGNHPLSYPQRTGISSLSATTSAMHQGNLKMNLFAPSSIYSKIPFSLKRVAASPYGTS